MYDIVLSPFVFPTKDPLDPPFNVIVGLLLIALLNVKLNDWASVLIKILSLLFPDWFVVYSINAPVVNVNGPVFRPWSSAIIFEKLNVGWLLNVWTSKTILPRELTPFSTITPTFTIAVYDLWTHSENRFIKCHISNIRKSKTFSCSSYSRMRSSHIKRQPNQIQICKSTHFSNHFFCVWFQL